MLVLVFVLELLWSQDELRKTETVVSVARQVMADENFGDQVIGRCIVSE